MKRRITARIDLLTVVAFALALSSIPVTPVCGQEEAWKEQVQENVRLEREIKSLADDTLSLYDELQAQNTRAQEAVDGLKPIQSQLLFIRNCTTQEHIDAIRREIDSLKVVKDQLTTIRDGKDQHYSQLNKDLTNLKMQAGEMPGYVQQSLQANIAVLGRRLSSLTDGQLDEMEQTLTLYTAAPGFDEYKSRLADTWGKLRLYKRALAAVSSPYDADSVARLLDELIPVCGLREDLPDEGKFALNDEQYDELYTLYIALSRYRGGVGALQGLIAKVNNDPTVQRCRAAQDKAGCIDAIWELLNTDEATYVRERYFEMIPYLGKLLQDYWDAVQDDPLATSSDEMLINQLEAK